MPTRASRRPTKTTATSTSRVTVKAYGREDNRDEELDIHVFETEPAYVRVNAGVTRSLGDYESLRVDVSISVPCYREQIDDTFDAVAQDVSEKLSQEVGNYLDGES